MRERASPGTAPLAPHDAFLAACRLDVEVLKPGNVSEHSAGHGMVAAQFVSSARAAVAPLFTRGARVGTRLIEAVRVTRAAVDCNTNLGIVLLVAPLAAALDDFDAPPEPHEWQAATERVLQTLDIEDARAAFRAIALANPGGLGDAPEQSVHAPPTVDLRAAMALAAQRDSIARQYVNGFADVFACSAAVAAAVREGQLETATLEAFFSFLGGWPDSHILRKHGLALAQSVTAAAREIHARWHDLARNRGPLAARAALAQWDAELKMRGLNPGTSADLTVATIFVTLAAAHA